MSSLSRYDFKIDYWPKTKNLADVLLQLFANKKAEKELVEENQKYLINCIALYWKTIISYLMQKCQAVVQQILYDEEYYFQEYYINIFKILITDTVASQKMKNIWSNISNFLFQELLHATRNIVIAHLHEFQQKDPMARAVQKH